MPSLRAWVQRPRVLIKRGRKHKDFYIESALIKVENVFEKANICNQSK